MYKCEKCDEKFKNPYKKDIDAGGVHDTGAVRRFEIPTINVCPNCLSTSIAKVKV